MVTKGRLARMKSRGRCNPNTGYVLCWLSTRATRLFGKTILLAAFARLESSLTNASRPVVTISYRFHLVLRWLIVKSIVRVPHRDSSSMETP